MAINKPEKTDLFIYGCFFLLSVFVCSSSCLNPFTLKETDADTSVYLTIARGITEGKVPYRDFFDNKGPVLYLLSAPGMAAAGFAGVWITQIIFMCLSVFFAYKTALFIGNRFTAFLGVIFSFLILNCFYFNVAGAEEYSMPFMAVSLYIFTKYYFTQREPAAAELITLGFCCAAAVLIRVNMFPLWFAFCLVIVIESLIKRDTSGLSKYILLFCAGFFVLFIPVMLYLFANNALSDFISQNFFAGGSRAFQDLSVKPVIRSFFVIIQKHFCFAPLAVGALCIIKNAAAKQACYYAGYMLAFLLYVFFLAVVRTSYNHYNMTLAPFMAPALAFVIQAVSGYFSFPKHNKAAVLLFFCVVFGDEILSGVSGKFAVFKDRSGVEIINLGKIIDQNTSEGDTIISLGAFRQIYLFTKRRPGSRYIYQVSGAEYYPGTKTEFIADMARNKPAVIAANKAEYGNLPQWFSPVYDMIANEYRVLADSDDYFLFKRKESP